MGVIAFPNRARVLTPACKASLAEANRALRQLRRLGCKVLSLRLAEIGQATEIMVDRNPHATLSDCPGVHVTVWRG